MELRVGERTIERPTSADVLREVPDRAPGSDFSIGLSGEGDAYLDADGREDGLYDVFASDGQRERIGAEPVDGRTLRPALQRFLAKDEGWIDAFVWRPPPEPPHRVDPAAKRIFALFAAAMTILFANLAGVPIFATFVAGLQPIGDAIAPFFAGAPNVVGLAALLPGLVSSVFLVTFLLIARRAARARRWPRVKGTVTHSAVVGPGGSSPRAAAFASGGGPRSYRPLIRYVYDHSGETFDGATIVFDQVISGSEGYARAVADRYPSGKAVDIHVDPASPANSALEVRIGAAWVLLAIAILGFALTAVAAFATRA